MERRSFLARLIGGTALAAIAPDRLLASAPVVPPVVPVAPPPPPPSDFWTIIRQAFETGEPVWVTDPFDDGPAVQAHVTAFSRTLDRRGVVADATVRTVDPGPGGFHREWTVSGSPPTPNP